MTAALERGEWSTARPDRTLPPVKTWYQFYRRLGGPQGRSGWAENLVPTGIRSRTVQPVVSRYTDWATGPTSDGVVIWFHFIGIRSLILQRIFREWGRGKQRSYGIVRSMLRIVTISYPRFGTKYRLKLKGSRNTWFFPETSGRKCHCTLRHTPEERRSHILRAGSLKSQWGKHVCVVLSVRIKGTRNGGQLETWYWNVELKIPGNFWPA